MTEWHTEAQLLREVAAMRTTSEIRHLIHFWTSELASLDQTKHLTNLRESRAYFDGWKRKDLRKEWEGSPTATCTTAMKTPERGGLLLKMTVNTHHGAASIHQIYQIQSWQRIGSPLNQKLTMWLYPSRWCPHQLHTTRNLTLYDGFLVMFSGNVMNPMVSMTFCGFPSWICIGGYWSPELSDVLSNSS